MQPSMAFSQTAKAESNMILEPNMNKYQESQMLFFADSKNKQRKVNSSRPKTIQEIKKL